MSKLLITTQVFENYGTAAQPHWKAKGSDDYVVKKFKGGDGAATIAVMGLRSKIECNNTEYREFVTSWSIVSDKHLTDYEKQQLEFDGKIEYSPKELIW